MNLVEEVVVLRSTTILILVEVLLFSQFNSWTMLSYYLLELESSLGNRDCRATEERETQPVF